MLAHHPCVDAGLHADDWTRTNMRERLQPMTRLPVEFAKDAAAACVAELVAGRGRHLKSNLYVFVGTLIGGGLVINGQPHAGVYGNADAIGSMPLGMADASRPGTTQQMLAAASLATLEDMLGASHWNAWRQAIRACWQRAGCR